MEIHPEPTTLSWYNAMRSIDLACGCDESKWQTEAQARGSHWVYTGICSNKASSGQWTGPHCAMQDHYSTMTPCGSNESGGAT